MTCHVTQLVIITLVTVGSCQLFFCSLDCFSLQQLYLGNFKDNGYDNISFIAGMTDRVCT